MKKLLFLFTAILLTGAAFAQKRPVVVSANSVNTKDVNKVIKHLKDENFVQDMVFKLKQQPFACEVWVTLDGTVHCKTTVSLTEDAEIFFLKPEITYIKANGTNTGVGGGYGYKCNVTVANGNDFYDFSSKPVDISSKPVKYNKLHSITVTVTSAEGVTGKFTITNTKIPEKMEIKE